MELKGRVVVRHLVLTEAVEVDGLGDLLEGLNQVEKVEIFKLGLFCGGVGRGAEGLVVDGGGGSAEALTPLIASAFEGVGSVAVLLVLKKLADEFGARVFLLLVARVAGAFGGGRRGHEHPALDFHQRRGHDEKLACEVDVDAGEALASFNAEELKVLLSDERDGDVVDVDFFALDEEEEEVERTFKGIKPDSISGFVRHGEAPLGVSGRVGACRGENAARRALVVQPVYSCRMGNSGNHQAPQATLEHGREILRLEADALAKTAAALDQRFADAVEVLVTCAARDGTVLVTGLGKSGLVGAKISATLASLGIPSHPVHPAEAAHGDLGRFRSRDAVIAISASGETEEVVALCALLRQDGLPIISITAMTDARAREGSGPSSLERMATVALRLEIGLEAGSPEFIAPTSSTTATMALGDALGLAAARRMSFTHADFARRHPGGTLGDLLRPVTEVLRFVAGKNMPVIADTSSVEAALREAASVARRPGALVLVDPASGAISGLFTDADLRRLILRDVAELSRPMREVMTRSPRTLPDTARVTDAVKLVRELRTDEIPVVDAQQRPVGILDVQDLVAMRLVKD